MRPRSAVKQEMDCSGRVEHLRSNDDRPKNVLKCLSTSCRLRVRALIAFSIIGFQADVATRTASPRRGILGEAQIQSHARGF